MNRRESELTHGCGLLLVLCAAVVVALSAWMWTRAESTVFESPLPPVVDSPLDHSGDGVIRAQVLGYEYWMPVIVVGEAQ